MTGRKRRDPMPMGDLVEPQEAIEPILAGPQRKALLAWLTEIQHEKLLNEVGLGARKKALFTGPPGVGKTTLSHHLAARIGLPMLIVYADRLLSKWAHQTAEQIGGVFDAIERADEPIVLFFDEIDTIGGHRIRPEGGGGATRDNNQSANVLLQRLERTPGFVIAATNFADQLDQALWRRFQLKIDLKLPGHAEVQLILARYLAPYGLPAHELSDLADAFASASPDLIRSFCEQLKREIVLGPILKTDMQRDAVLARLLETIKPHEDLGLPELWSRGHLALGWRGLSWPLERAETIKKRPKSRPARGATVLTYPKEWKR